MRQTAVLLLVAGALRHLVWPLFPPDQQALAWNLAGALAIGALLSIIWRQNRGRYVALIVAWFLYEEALVSICSLWRLFDNWVVPLGEGQCTAKLGPKIISISLVALGAIIERLNYEHPADR